MFVFGLQLCYLTVTLIAAPVSPSGGWEKNYDYPCNG